MARGDVKAFAAFIQKAKDAVSFDLNAGDTLKLGIVTNATIPTVDISDPRWGAGGGTNFSLNQVGTATAYTGPITLTNVVWTRTGSVTKLDFDDVSIPLDATGFANGYYAIFYDDTVAGKYAIGFADLGGPISIVGGPLNIGWNAGGVLTWTTV